jgi:hypothetical protein
MLEKADMYAWLRNPDRKYLCHGIISTYYISKSFFPLAPVRSKSFKWYNKKNEFIIEGIHSLFLYLYKFLNSVYILINKLTPGGA